MANRTLIFIRAFGLMTVILVSRLCFANDSKVKSSGMGEVFAVIQRLQSLASDASSPKKVDRQRVAKEIDSIRDPEFLAKLAVLCRAIAEPGRAEDAAFDGWFHQAFLECVYKLRDMNDPNALAQLLQMKGAINFDGGDSLTINEAIKTQKDRSSHK